MPVSLDLAETDWEAVHLLGTDHPSLPVVLTRVNYRQERFLYPLWARHRNLYVDISLFQAHRAIEEAVSCYGHERLLFGTGLPFYEAGGPMMMVRLSEIAPASQCAIAGSNLRRLLSEVVGRTNNVERAAEQGGSK